MKRIRFHGAIRFAVVMVLLVLAAQVSAETGQPKADVTGDWQVKMNFNEMQMEAILSLSKDAEDKLVGKWISGWGVGDLKDVKYEENKLSFVQVNRFRGTESTSNFAGTIKDDKLSGIFSGERGEFTAEGTRIKPMQAAVGNWEIITKKDKQEKTATLTVRADKDGKLTAEWRSPQGKSEITDVNFIKDKLTFTRKATVEGKQKESNYDLTIKGNALWGTVKTHQGETKKVEGKLLGTELIGKWELTITSERGDRMQMLQVNPDLSGLYGATAVEKINLEGDQVSFKFVMRFRERTTEAEFKGKLEGGKLAGEITGFGDTARKVTGKKLVPTPVVKKDESKTGK